MGSVIEDDVLDLDQTPAKIRVFEAPNAEISDRVRMWMRISMMLMGPRAVDNLWDEVTHELN